MNKFEILILCLAFAVPASAQVGCFSLDSIPKNNAIKLILNPASGDDVFHAMDILRIAKNKYMIFYSSPAIYAGGAEEQNQGLVITEELKSMIDKLLCTSAIHYATKDVRRRQRNTGNIPNYAYSVNPEDDLTWKDMYMQLEEMLFGVFIHRQYENQVSYLAIVSERLVGCYNVLGNELIALNSSDIQLTKSNYSMEDIYARCTWCFTPDFVTMSDPCYNGVEMTWRWRLILEDYELRICLFSQTGDDQAASDCVYSFYSETPESTSLLLTSKSRFVEE